MDDSVRPKIEEVSKGISEYLQSPRYTTEKPILIDNLNEMGNNSEQSNYGDVLVSGQLDGGRIDILGGKDH